MWEVTAVLINVGRYRRRDKRQGEEMRTRLNGREEAWTHTHSLEEARSLNHS